MSKKLEVFQIFVMAFQENMNFKSTVSEQPGNCEQFRSDQKVHIHQVKLVFILPNQKLNHISCNQNKKSLIIFGQNFEILDVLLCARILLALHLNIRPTARMAWQIRTNFLYFGIPKLPIILYFGKHELQFLFLSCTLGQEHFLEFKWHRIASCQKCLFCFTGLELGI